MTISSEQLLKEAYKSLRRPHSVFVSNMYFSTPSSSKFLKQFSFSIVVNALPCYREIILDIIHIRRNIKSLFLASFSVSHIATDESETI